MTVDAPKAAFVFSESELDYLLRMRYSVQVSPQAKYLLCRYFPPGTESEMSIENLLSKNLARRVSGVIITEPVVDLLIKAILSANRLWVVENAETGETVFVLRDERMYLTLRRYPHIAEAWKLTPFENEKTLSEELAQLDISKVLNIDENGTVETDKLIFGQED